MIVSSAVKEADQKIILSEIDDLIRCALEEDIRSRDLTTERIVPKDMTSRARWIAKEEGVVAGLFVGEAIFRILDENLRWEAKVEEGNRVQVGEVLVEMEGKSRALLTGERTALNFVQRMSGIAMAAAAYTDRLKGIGTKILDTRKTVPGLRALDKYAVKTGGGTNHRAGLFDMVLIKENHIAIAGGITEAVDRAKSGLPRVKVEVETTSLQEVEQALESGADMILLDNMSLDKMGKAVQIINGRAEAEASGNVMLENINEIAATGVDYISVGALTHSVRAFDISQMVI